MTESLSQLAPSGGNLTPGLAHPGRIAVAAGVGLMVSYAIASRDTVPDWELTLTEWLNDAPDIVAVALWPVMQLGTVWAPLVIAGVVYSRRRDAATSLALVGAGLVSWFGAKGIKLLVERGRPPVYIDDLTLRETVGTSFGYISGHAAVAASTAVIVASVLPARWRPMCAVLAGLVGVGRVVYGVHLPVDVIGGWSFGALVGLAALGIAAHYRRPSVQDGAVPDPTRP